MGFLDNFKIETWYSLILYVGIVGTFGTIFVPMQGFEKSSVLPLFLGMALIGLGEWKMERCIRYIKPPNVHTGPAAVVTQNFQSKDDLIGIVLEVIGLILIGLSLFRILF